MTESYVLHEYLVPVNEPVYFQQFVECGAQRGTDRNIWPKPTPT